MKLGSRGFHGRYSQPYPSLSVVEARFGPEPPPDSFRIRVTREGHGKASERGPRDHLRPDLRAWFDNGSQVTLTAVPKEGWEFVRWGNGGCKGQGPTCVLDMTQNRRAEAVFAKD